MRSEVFSVLKEVIKSRGLNYKKVSEELEMSESGFKKLMSSKDCSISKLDEICSILNLSFEDLVALSKEKNDKVTLDKKQELLFQKKPAYYHFFIELISNNYDWQRVKAKHKLTKKECILILISLDKVNLIRLEAGNKVKKVFEGGDISISAKLGELVTWDIDEAFFYHARNEFKSMKRTACGTRGKYYLKKESLDEMIESVKEITQEFAKRSKREEILYSKENLKEVTLLAFIAQGFEATNHIKL